MTDHHPVSCKACGADCRDYPGRPCPECGNAERVYSVTASMTAPLPTMSASVVVVPETAELKLRGMPPVVIVEPAPAAEVVTEIEVVGLGKVPLNVPPGIVSREQRLEMLLQQLVDAALRVVDTDCAGDSQSRRQVPAVLLEQLRAIAEDIERRLRIEL